MKTRPIFLALLLLPFCLCNAQESPATQTALGKSGLLRSGVFLGKHFLVCEADPQKYKIEAFNQLPDGKGVYTFNELKKQKKDSLIFAMNGGMYEKDLSPVGLFIAHGKTYKNINLQTDLHGNFYMMPNGIFILEADHHPKIVKSGDYVFQQSIPGFATQSGPMLVINGTYNANFNEHSTNVNIRNGVGINKAGHVVFVISAEPVNFYEFAELFKTQLNCENALYLDGLVSQYYAPELMNAPLPGVVLGTFLTVSKK